MGLLTRLMGMRDRGAVLSRVLDVPSGDNVRELGGYAVPGGMTRRHRFLRSGSCSSLSKRDLAYLEGYGVRRVIDLRSDMEAPRRTDRFFGRHNIEWLNVPLFDYDLSDPKLVPPEGHEHNYLIEGYLQMVSNREAVCEIMEFASGAGDDDCVLFHCAAGMDRTGIVAMMLLGLVGVRRHQIIADYMYSFAPIKEADRIVEHWESGKSISSDLYMAGRVEAIATVYDTVTSSYGSVRDYLLACGVGESCLEAINTHLVEREGHI